MRILGVLIALSVSSYCTAQFPHTRVLDVRVGQQRPAVERLVQDRQGLLWVGSGYGILRTDGERVDVILRTEHATVTAMAADRVGVVAALSDGRILRCTGAGCDTLLIDSVLMTHQVRSIVHTPDGKVVLGSYGDGIRVLDGQVLLVVNGSAGLPDDHVNDLCLLSDGRLVAATDQGLALLDNMKVTKVFGEAQGAPDNLVLSVASEGSNIWAGTDRSGVFRWTPGGGSNELWVPDPRWEFGPVAAMAVHGDYLWSGTDRNGVVLFDLGDPMGAYQQHVLDQRSMGVRDIIVDRDGAALWCTGSERLHRADPAVLVVPEHEGLDLRGITALAYDHQDRIWFATPDGLFSHAAAFAEGLTVTRSALRLKAGTSIVSLAAGRSGIMWAATFGDGVYAIHPDGHIAHYTVEDGLMNNNVLSARAKGDTVWFGTLAGVSEFHAGEFIDHGPFGSGFVYDLLPLPDGRVLSATDGSGVVPLVGPGAGKASSQGPRTYYSMITDKDGKVWAAGPGTGLCGLQEDTVVCIGADRPPFDESLYAIAQLSDHILAIGNTGVGSYDPTTGQWMDITARTGLEDIEAELNAICTDSRGAIWLACNKGMIRIRPTRAMFDPSITTVITSMMAGSEAIHMGNEMELTHDRNDISFQFTGLHYAAPGALRFEVRLSGREERHAITRDREIAWSDLSAGDYLFQVRSFTEGSPRRDEWTEVAFTILPPWWKLPWVIALALILVVIVVVLLLRSHDRRVRERERMESEKVRFQLEALRSQVDPHFLFNSFNTLMELIASDPDRALGHVEQLSTFFRNILLVRDQDLITLEEELRLLSTYFALERIRFGEAIELDIEIAEGPRSNLVIPMTLQLLVENALKHNMATLKDPLKVRIMIMADMLVVTNAIRPKLSPPRSTEFGLESIRKRYASITGRRIEVEKDEERFTVRIPLMIVE